MDHFCYLCFCVFHASCMFIVALWSSARKKANLLALLNVMFSCVFVTFPCGVLGQVWHLIVLITDRCLLNYFNLTQNEHKFL